MTGINTPEESAAVGHYMDALKEHDWSFEFSDDHRAWARGTNQLARLRLLQRQLDPDFIVWNQFCHPKCLNGATYA